MPRLALVLLLLAACDQSPDPADAEEQGAYDLVLAGEPDRSPTHPASHDSGAPTLALEPAPDPREADASPPEGSPACRLGRTVAGAFALDGRYWHRVDTVVTACADGVERRTPRERRGEYDRAGDTLELRAHRGAPGDGRFRARGHLRGDTLRVRGYSYDAGTWVYVRRRPPDPR